MMLCDPQAPEFDDLEMANYITQLAENPMPYSQCWQSTMENLLLERGSIHTAIALSRCQANGVFMLVTHNVPPLVRDPAIRPP